MKKIILIAASLALFGFLSAQTGEVINDTIYVQFKETRPIQFSKAIGTVLYVKGIVPEDLPEKKRKFIIISSKSNEIDADSVTVVNKTDIMIPVSVFLEKYYTLYIKKGNATVLTKRIVIK